ncbi:MAG: 50S ribosomal protein L9 [Candidatus Moranbacteria bacterium]|nr:50S ribosomal protein L9 [Candidatus Moranbacteria bacterium]
MKVILLQDVERFGKAGDVKEVRNGYGFNFLLPQGLAEFATPQAVKQTERLIAKRHKELEGTVADFKMKAAELEGKSVTIKSKAEKDKLFGSVGREEIALSLQATGMTIDAKFIVLEKPLKVVGTFPVEADFGHDVKATFSVVIEAE